MSQTQEAIDKLEKQLDKKYYYNTNSNHQYDKLEKSIKNTIVSSQLEYERKLKIKDDEITALKNSLRELNESLAYEMAPTKQGPRETMYYTAENSRILKYEHGLKLDRFKQMQRQRREAYLQTLDLNNSSDKVKWQDFQDKLKLELYAEKQKYWKIERDFKKKGMIVKN